MGSEHPASRPVCMQTNRRQCSQPLFLLISVSCPERQCWSVLLSALARTVLSEIWHCPYPDSSDGLACVEALWC